MASKNIKIKHLKAQAFRLLQSKQYKEAMVAFEKICKLHAGDAESWCLLGAINGQLGNMDKAILCSKQAISLTPEYVDAYFNLAQAYMSTNQFSDAALNFHKVIKTNPQNEIAFRNLCICLKRSGQESEAANHYQQLIQLGSAHASDYAELGLIYFERRNYSKAEELYIKALKIEPENANTLNLLGNYYRVKGQINEATSCFQKALKFNPALIGAKYYLAAMDDNTSVPDATPPKFVKACYNSIAETYDQVHTADKLGYSVPTSITNMIKQLISADTKLNIIDIGCGTGLCGPLLRNISNRLVGVDLSPGMLEKAREKNAYDEIICADLVETLQSYEDAFDLVISTGVFIHLGDLYPVFQACHKALKSGGLFGFSTHEFTGDGYHLNTTGHYSHAESYINKLSHSTKFKIELQKKIIIYTQAEQKVFGYLYIIRAN